MADDNFDPNSILDTEYTGDLNTRTVPIPEGVYFARVKEGGAKVRKFTSAKNNETYTVADITFSVEDDEVKAATQLTDPTVRATIFLDLAPGTGQILTKEENPNANVQLGRLKQALGIREGKPWSIRGFEGLGCYIKVVQKADDNDIENINNNVTGFYRDKKDDKAGGRPRRVA